MILAVDIGNTNITIGIYNNEKLLFVLRAATDRSRSPDQYAVEFFSMLRIHNADGFKFRCAIISSVVPELTNVIKDAFFMITGQTAILIGPGVKTVVATGGIAASAIAVPVKKAVSKYM